MRDITMSPSVGASETGYVFQPQTAAGQAMVERRSHGRLELTLADSQTSLFDPNIFGDAATAIDDFTVVAPYDYARDEVFEADETVVDGEAEVSKPQRLFGWVTRNAVLP